MIVNKGSSVTIVNKTTIFIKTLLKTIIFQNFIFILKWSFFKKIKTIHPYFCVVSSHLIQHNSTLFCAILRNRIPLWSKKLIFLESLLDSYFRYIREIAHRDWKKDTTLCNVSYVHSTKYKPSEIYKISKFGLLLYKCQKSLHSTKIAYLTARFGWLPCHVLSRIGEPSNFCFK